MTQAGVGSRGLSPASITTSRTLLPSCQFQLLGVVPRPWTVEDLLLVSRLAATDVSWLIFARLLRGHERLEEADWQALWPLMQTGDMMPWPKGALEAALGMVRGSNSAAVSASRARNGAGMIASDPHLFHQPAAVMADRRTACARPRRGRADDPRPSGGSTGAQYSSCLGRHHGARPRSVISGIAGMRIRIAACGLDFSLSLAST